ncbi:MAG TPA: NAD(+) diphosphatase [Steroidobacteraceae bacterium]|nr:NAD(+) diphosphatase [Steroidobacteraceae bacterium]
MSSRTDRPNIFAGPYLDRRSELREREDWLAQAGRDPHARFVPVWQSRNLFVRGDAPGAVLLTSDHVVVQAASPESVVFLGLYHEQACFLVELEGEQPPEIDADGEFRELRFFGALLPQDEAGLLAYARALTLWRQRHRFCGVCGSPTRAARAGHVLVCSNASCRSEQFPRIDPAIIVLVTHGERALLGRQTSWPAGRYSTIAGFVEPGESLEDAVAREVREETGITVSDIRYHSSQPWPFPSSIMLGFTARASGTDLVRTDQELEDVRWFSRADIASGFPAMPSIQSISFRLIEDWYDSDAGQPLRETPGVRL